ncbi:MAG: Ultraviolet N-glycosylase/AP lyase [Elusimicrobia bacterium ADurb.Bin231]|nr:MAG: Ultraviolet N-glycosylase/AP lyase [Elusimicrobia bacterium ADurb.Bin231]
MKVIKKKLDLKDTDCHTSEILKRLFSRYKYAPATALHFSTPLEILVATILSAQCTDERVNKITPWLFKKYHTARDYAQTPVKILEQEIRTAGFYHNKAKNIIGACHIIDKKYAGRVPDKMEELIQLPGVARKTANIVLGNAYGIVVGIAVDTHVRRLSNRLGFTKENIPEKIEKDLMNLIERKNWFNISNILIEHGRKVCKASKPGCESCFISDICPKIGIPVN